MSHEVSAVVQTANTLDKNDLIFSLGACQSMVEQLNATIFPVLFNYDMSRKPVGKTIGAYLEGDKVIVHLELIDPLPPYSSMYAGPTITLLDLERELEVICGSDIITELKVVGFSIFHMDSVDPGATPLKYVSQEKSLKKEVPR
jgi:hypothetical protein